MASSFDQILAEFITELDDPALTSANVKIGRRETESSRTYPSIVFVPMGGPIEDPDRVGHGKIDDVNPNVRKRILYLRKPSVLVECHGANRELAENLLHKSIVALRAKYHASIEFGEEGWPSQEDESDDFNKDGELVTFTFTVHIPIVDVDKTLKVVTTIVDGADQFGDEVLPCEPGT